MSLEQILTFAFGMFVLALAPGPGVAAVVARALSGGMLAAMGVITGLVIGDVIFMSLALAGLTALASTAAPVFAGVKYIGAAYLFWLGYKALTTKAAPLHAADTPAVSPLKELGMGLLVTLGNPKPILFYGALMPTFLDVAHVTIADAAVLAAIIAAVSYIVLGGYSLLAHRSRRLLSTPRAVRRLNQTTGVVMIAAGTAIATR